MVGRVEATALMGVLLIAGAVVTGCSDLSPSTDASGSGGETSPELLIFVFDRSTSVLDHELEHARRLTRDRLDYLRPGDRIVAMELLELSLAEEPQRWSQVAPVPQFPGRRVQSDSLALDRFIQDAQSYIAAFSEPEGREDFLGTDILSTLHLVSGELQAYPELRPTLILFSDMLQANAVMNMEGLVRMPPPDWVQTRAAEGTLPELVGLCVVVVGARTDHWAAQRVRAFWEEYFEVTGAALRSSNYDYRPVRLPLDPC